MPIEMRIIFPKFPHSNPNSSVAMTREAVYHSIIRSWQKGDVVAFIIQDDRIPLRVDEQGVIRVGDSQVLLDIVIREFNNGSEPESIANGFPTLDLADVYAVIAYYLRHRNDIDDYIQTRYREANLLRQEIQSKQSSPTDLRAKLLARKAQTELAHASLAQ